MDIDAFVAAHQHQWDRLRELAATRRLTGKQADELVSLYRVTAGHLSRVRTSAPDPQVVAELSSLVASARSRVTGSSRTGWSVLRDYVTTTMPAALYRVRWWSLWTTIVSVLLAVLAAWWTLRSPAAMSALGTPKQLDSYANDAFASYYTNYAPHEFAGQVWTNNARIAAICVAGGITGVLPAWMMLSNALNVGQAAAILIDHGLTWQFFALILPHGLLELTSVFVAGGAGLKLFWTLLVPGHRSRTDALAEEGRTLITVAVALTISLGGAGLIEGFVTGAQIPWALKITLGVLSLALFLAYMLVLGARAQASVKDGGIAGDLEAEDAGAKVAVAG
ncbi:stage II sporulation protein M [Actinomyces trachealis]|uniref:stage II sporulation protein M n=1 Tax=Actinomyces trachealis TaxID=2763540 RepID=UPI001892A0F0|nr:stage II sporulation protein M [Actinomyces trachealis]